MNLKDWKQQWGVDNLVFAPENCNQLPDIAHRFLTTYGFPRRFIIENDPRIDYGVEILTDYQGGDIISSEISFEYISQPLTRYYEDSRWGDYKPEIDIALSQQIKIGVEEFCNGHAHFSVNELSETITRIDISHPSLNTFVNSSVPQFGQ